MLAGKTDYTVKPALLSAIDVMIAPFRADPRRPCAAARTGRPVGAARMRRQAFRPADEASGALRERRAGLRNAALVGLQRIQHPL
ncbi:hypothetical protein, partial [Burkholderia cenocepacia]|uniref:hypothetical protein n=1 Tax=Burkholderia cenocepacia TaxID=95486 RepID=UPI0039C863DA